MTFENSFLLTYDDVYKIGGTFFIEIKQGSFDIGKNGFWHKNSIYVDADIWSDFFDEICVEWMDGYDYFSDITLNSQQSKFFALQLVKIAENLLKIKHFNDLKNDELCSRKTNQPYIRFDNGISDLVYKKNEILECKFLQNFTLYQDKLVNSYQSLAKWININSKFGISILGI